MFFLGKLVFDINQRFHTVDPAGIYLSRRKYSEKNNDLQLISAHKTIIL